MYTVMKREAFGLDIDMCCDGEYSYMNTEEEAKKLLRKLNREFGKYCSDLHPWKGATFYIQEVSDEYIRYLGNY